MPGIPETPKRAASTALPGRKLVTSKKPRMLTPSEVDLLRQDLRAALTFLGQDEVDDAHHAIRECGFRTDDFEILERPNPSPSLPGPVTGLVVVLRKSNSVRRIYAGGHASQWPSEFRADLRAGLFGGVSTERV
jgi:hypothetical protein